MTQSFEEDCADLIGTEEKKGMSRRDLLKFAASIGIPMALVPGMTRKALAADAKEVVLCNWGGVALEVFEKAFAEPYEAKGGKMVIDGSGPGTGKILNMVMANNVTWDIVDSGIVGLTQLGPQGALEEIDYSIVDKSKVIPEFAYDYGVVNYMFSSVLAWDSEKVDGTPTLADFFDLEKYPGRRLLRKDAQAMLELTLLADGVAIEDLYPLDVERALAKLATIKDELLFWGSGSESQSLLREGECVMGMIWNTRANVLEKETDGRIKYTFEGGLLQPGLWAVPKGNPAGKQTAMEAIASMQAPEGQVMVLEAMGNGPANPAASELVPEDLAASNPASAENVAKQARISADWYAEHYADAMQEYLDFITS